MPDDALAVMDSPEIDTGAVDTPVEDFVSAESTEGTTQETEQAPLEELGETSERITDEPSVLEGKRLSPATLKALEPIKATNPKLYKELVHGQFLADRFRREVPGGFKEISDLKAQVEQFGGTEGLQATRAELAQWDDFDQKFTNADPAFIDELATTSPESFLKLVPPAIAKFAQLHPDGYKNYIAKVVNGDMIAGGVPGTIERLRDFIEIGNGDKAMAILGQLEAYFNGWRELATKQVEAPKMPGAPPSDAQAAEVQRQNQELTVQVWGNARQQIRNNVFNAEWNRLSSGIKLSDTQRAHLEVLFEHRLKQGLTADKFGEQAQRYLKANDKDGYLRLAKSLYEKNIPAAMAAIFSESGLKKAGAKPAAQAQPQNGTAQPRPTNGTAAAGFQWVGKVPDRDTIDWRTTSASLYSTGKAILRGGKKIQWRSQL